MPDPSCGCNAGVKGLEEIEACDLVKRSPKTDCSEKGSCPAKLLS